MLKAPEVVKDRLEGCLFDESGGWRDEGLIEDGLKLLQTHR